MRIGVVLGCSCRLCARASVISSSARAFRVKADGGRGSREHPKRHRTGRRRTAPVRRALTALGAAQFGVIVLTTSAGIMDHEEARRKKVGGKVRRRRTSLSCMSHLLSGRLSLSVTTSGTALRVLAQYIQFFFVHCGGLSLRWSTPGAEGLWRGLGGTRATPRLVMGELQSGPWHGWDYSEPM